MIDRRTFVQMSAGALVAPAALAPSEQPLTGLNARLDPVAQMPASGGNGFRARLQGSGWYKGLDSHIAWDQRGKVYRFSSAGTSVLIDVKARRLNLFFPDQLGNSRAGGLRGFAEHPDFNNPSKRGYGKVYTTTFEKIGQRQCPVLRGNYPLKYHAILVEWDVHTGAQREVLAVAYWKHLHPIDTVVFGPIDHFCYLTVGDGGYRKQDTVTGGDPYHQVQNLNSPLGKVLRINPLQSGTRTYTVPADNPYQGQAGKLKEIWCYGLRHPEHLFFAPNGDGYMTDIGASVYEKMVYLKKGANYGWPIKEGDPGARYARPLAVWDRRAYAKAAACGGPIVTSGPLAGNVLWGDLVSGRIFYTATDPSGIVKPFYELQLSTPLLQLAGGDTRCDMRMGLGSNGEIFITTKTDGFVRELAVL